MSGYFTNFTRAFKPGTPFSVWQQVIEEFQTLELEAPGVVTGTPYAPIYPGGVMMLSRLHEDASGVDKYHQAIQESSKERQDLVASINEHCVSIKMRISRVILEGNYVGSNPPSYIVRNYVKAKRGFLDEVIETLSSFIEDIPSDKSKPLLSETTTGRSNLLVVATAYETLADAEEGYLRVRSGAKTARGKRLSDITEENMRIPTKIFHSTMQIS